MDTDNLIRRYWAGGYHFGQNNQLEKFVADEIWKTNSSKEDIKNEQFYQKISEVKIGDFFALKNFEESHDLTISALGIVIDTTNKTLGELNIKWLKHHQFYKSKVQKGLHTGSWFETLLEIKKIEDIAEIFQPLFEPQEEAIRIFTSNSDAFGFWNNKNEDIYQDYLK